MMTVYGRMLLAGAGSALLLIGALGFQYLGGLAPCPLCLWQRWPHAAAVALALLGMTLLWPRPRSVAWAGGATMLAGAGIAAYHSGVERGWWSGPAACSAPASLDLPADALLDRILAAPLVRCDEIPWDLAGLSMANWNALVSLALAVIWLWPAPAVRR